MKNEKASVFVKFLKKQKKLETIFAIPRKISIVIDLLLGKN